MSIFIDELIKKHGNTMAKDIIPAEDMMFTDENQNVKVKFIITYISGARDNTGKNVLKGIEFNLLVKYEDNKL